MNQATSKFLLLVMVLLGCQQPVSRTSLTTHVLATQAYHLHTTVEALNQISTSTPLQAEVHESKSPWHEYPNTCETFEAIESQQAVKTQRGRSYPVYYKRNRVRRKISDQDRTRDLIRMVVREMGGDREAQQLIAMIASHESSHNPQAIHILNPDREANQKAWVRHRYDAAQERRLLDKMASTSANSPEYWTHKAQLRDLQLYKDNPYWDENLVYLRKIPERLQGSHVTPAAEFPEISSVWSFGYGLYGMNAVLFTHYWDTTAPPWVLCDDGIIATVVAVWSLREAQKECDLLTQKSSERWGSDGGTSYGVVRRFARGHCSDKKLGPVWTDLMKTYHIETESRPNLGKKFPWKETDRVELLNHLREQARKENLLN